MLTGKKRASDDWAMQAARQFAESAAGEGLKIPISAVADVFRRVKPMDIDLSGIERVYSTEETADFFSKSPQWMYWALKPREEGGGGLFYKPVLDPETGDPVRDEEGHIVEERIEPMRVGKRGIFRFDLDMIGKMAASLYRRATIKTPEMEEVLRRIQLARMGRWSPKTKGG